MVGSLYSWVAIVRSIVKSITSRRSVACVRLVRSFLVVPVLATSALFLSSCSTSQNNAQQLSQEDSLLADVQNEDQTDGSNIEDLDEDEAGMRAISEALGEDMPNGDSVSSNTGTSERPFPKVSGAFDIQTHILGYPQPEEAFISVCKEKISQLSLNSRNPQSIKISSSQFQSVVSTNTQDYHWCFFHIVRELDIGLSETKHTISDKMDIFLSQMTKLWIFSTALKNVTNDPSYLNLTKERYIEYSNDYFGRNIEVINLPLAH